jgi:hypothetical protein
VTEKCAYGQTSCTVCNASCKSVAGTATYCGDGSTQGGNGEQCDDGNAVTETCAYGQTSCTVCNDQCKSVAGATSRCGDGVVDATNGEECDTSGASETCTASCKLQKYCIITQTLTGSFELTDAISTGTFAQTGGTSRIRVPDVNGAPANGGNAAVLYYKMPTVFSTSALGTTVTTNIITTGGTPTNLCPLNRGTLTGTDLTFPACPYGPNHCDTDWTPDDQKSPKITPTAGCMPVTATGNINCSGNFCSFVGLKKGDNAVNDTWMQPQTTVRFNAAFTSSHLGSLGDTTTCGKNNDRFEVPERAAARSWINGDGVVTTIECGQLPATGCN